MLRPLLLTRGLLAPEPGFSVRRQSLPRVPVDARNLWTLLHHGEPRSACLATSTRGSPSWLRWLGKVRDPACAAPGGRRGREHKTLATTRLCHLCPWPRRPPLSWLEGGGLPRNSLLLPAAGLAARTGGLLGPALAKLLPSRPWLAAVTSGTQGQDTQVSSGWQGQMEKRSEGLWLPGTPVLRFTGSQLSGLCLLLPSVCLSGPWIGSCCGFSTGQPQLSQGQCLPRCFSPGGPV